MSLYLQLLFRLLCTLRDVSCISWIASYTDRFTACCEFSSSDPLAMFRVFRVFSTRNITKHETRRYSGTYCRYSWSAGGPNRWSSRTPKGNRIHWRTRCPSFDNCPLSANRSFLHIDDPGNSDSASCGSESDEHARSRRSESNKTTRAVVSLFGLLMTQKEQSETRMAKASTLVAHDATSSQILCARVSRSMVVPTTNVRAAIAIG